MNQTSSKQNALLLAALYTAIIGIGMYLSFHWAGYRYGEPGFVRVLVWVELVLMLVTLFWVKRFWSWREIGIGRFENLKEFWWLAPPAIIFILAWAGFISDFQLSGEHIKLFLLIGFTTLLVGISEEIVFRGVLLHGFLKNSSVWTAMLVSALAFSLLHSVNYFGGLESAGVISQLKFTFVFGLFFAPLAIRLGTIVPLILFHWLWDFLLIGGTITANGSPAILYFMMPLMIVESVILWISIWKFPPPSLKKSLSAIKPNVATGIFSILIVLIALDVYAYYHAQEARMKEFLKKENAKIVTNSATLTKQLHIPEAIAKNIVVFGNAEAKTVLINSQGGPMTSLANFELSYTINQTKIDKDDLLLVNVHQYQTLRTEEFETKLINFEEAKQYDAASTKMLSQTVEYFKKEGYVVIVMGISFGAFVVEDLLASYPPVADKYLIVVGRLDMPEAVWREFSKGNYVGFKYANGVSKIVKFSADEAGMGGGNTIGDKNSAILAAGLGYKRFTQLLYEKDLRRVEYFYGGVDDQVGRLSKLEIDFLKSKGVKPVRFDKNHSDSIDAFSLHYLKNIVDKLKKVTADAGQG